MSKYTDYARYYEAQLSRTSFADNVRRKQAIDKGSIIDLQAFNPDNDASIVAVLAEGALFTTGVELADYLGILPPSAPDTPFGLLAKPRDSALEISFSGGSNARNYLYSIDGNVFTPLNPPQLYSPITVSGLTNGVSYTISVKGINDIGSSLASSPVTGIPLSFPQPPQSLITTLGNSAIYIDFVPGSNGGTPITNYEVSINDVTFSPFSPPTTSSPLYISGLANGITYTLYLRAINALGSSLSSANITATPATSPQEPTSLRIAPGNTSLNISFTPGFNGGASIINYEYSINGGAYTPFSPPQTRSPVLITGLINGVSYTISLKAVNFIGESPVSSSVTGIPARVPDSPTALVATPSNASISISFTPGANNGNPITNYQYSLDGSTFTDFSPVVTTSPVRIGGLSNGTLYTVYLAAINLVGSSFPSAPVTAIPVTLPSPPTSLVATPSNAQIIVSFSNGDTGGTDITNYKYSLDGSNYALFSPAVTSSPAIVTGLSNGTLYTIYLKAVNAVGTSTAFASVNGNPATFPSPPTSLVATPSNTSIRISFSNADTGGRALTNYEYSLDGSNYTLFTPPLTSSPAILTGLSNGTSYTVYLQAVTAFGSSTPAGPVTANPVTFPSPPTSLVATPSNTSISISFSNADTGGRALANYEYSLDGSNYTLFTPAVTSSPAVLTGLSNGTSYTVYLQAVTVFGSSTPAGPVTANPVTFPSPPTSLVATPSNTSIRISFSNADNGGRALTNYEYSLDGSNYSLFNPPITSSPAILAGLSNGTSYSVYLQAVTAFGSSTPAGPVTANPVTFPSPPTSLVATPSNTSISISFSNADTGGRALANYEYSLDGSNYTLFTPAVTSSPAIVTGLSNGTSYTVYLQAVTVFGSSTPAGPVTANPVTFPSPPTSLVATPSNTSIRISFSNADNGGRALSNYEYSLDGSNYTLFNPPITSSPAIVTGLSNGTSYTVYLQAVTVFGSSTPAGPVTAIPATFPSPPTSLVATPSNTSISISFSNADTGGRALTNYEYSLDGSNYTLFTPAVTSSPAIVTGLSNGTSYTVYLQAVTAFGSSTPAGPVTANPVTFPSPPTSLVATPSNAQISISFSNADNGGRALTNYEYSLDGSNYTLFNPPITSSPAVLTGLSNGTSYTVYLQAVTVFGSSTPAGPVTAIPATLPSPPTSLVATPSNTSISISFSNADTGGRALANYEYSLDGSNYTLFNPPITSSPAVLTGLSNGTSYTVYLQAVTVFGSSTPAGPVTANPVTFPSPPTSLVATPSNTSISISFSNADTGGRALTNYEYSLDGSNYTLFNPPITSSPAILTGLSNGTSYTVYLQAVTVFGSSTPAGPVTAIPATLPSPPTSLVATPSNTSISISFSNADTGGRALSNYEYSLDGSNYILFTPAVTSSPAIVTGLSNGTSYTVYLQAVTVFGSSTPAGPVTANPVTFPSPPTALVATPSNAQISISFSNADTGGRALANYEYSLDGSNYTLFNPPITSSPAVLAGLSNGTSYSVYLQAVTVFGSSTPAGPVTAIPVTLPSPPTALVATPSNAQISISFSNGDTGGSDITNYRYSLDGSNYTLFSPAVTSSPAIVTGLTNGTLYTVYLKSVNAVGTSTGFASVSATPARVSDAPTSLFAAIQDSSLLISFTPGSNGGSPITNYQYSLDGNTYTPFSPPVPTSPVEVTGLTNGISYTVYLAAINSMGAGATASVTQTPNPPVLPNPPTELAVIPADSSLTIPFTAGFDGRSIITNYSYSIDGTTFTPLSPAQSISPVTVSGLSNGVVYTLYLKAINGVGSSITSSPITASPIPASFAPTSIAGARLWLNSLSPSSVIVSGSNVTGWNDTSGTSNHFTASGGIIKYGGTGQINNRPAIHFTTGSPTFTRLSRTFQLSSSAQVLSLFIILQQTGISSAGSNSIIFASSNATVNSFSLLTDSSSNLIANIGGTDRNTNSNIVNSPVLVSVIFGRSPNAVYINGKIPSAGVSNFALGSMSLNGLPTWSISGRAFLGYIGEIISYPSALSILNQQKVEGYLAWKWGIQSELTSQSVWKYTPPTGDSIPTTPQQLYVLAGDSYAYIYFTASSGIVINYEYTINSGTSYTAFSLPLIRSPAYVSLANDISYTLLLRSYNGGGYSSPSASYNIFYPANANFPTPKYLIDPNNASCYSGSGTSIANIGSNGSTSGTIVGSVSYGIGSNLSENVFTFTGGYMVITQPFSSGFNSYIAASAWVYPYNTSNSYLNTIFGCTDCSFGWSNSSLFFQTYGPADSILYYNMSTSNVILQNTWQHVAVLYNPYGSSNFIFLFVNGSNVTSGNNITSRSDIRSVKLSGRYYVGAPSSNTNPLTTSNITKMNGQLGLLNAYQNASGAINQFIISQVVNQFNATRAAYGV